jgi:transcriptional regulator with XRE-family HTH domain
MGQGRYPVAMERAFGGLVRARLKALSLSLRGFAKLVNREPGDVSKILSGKHGPHPPPVGKELDAWAKALEVPLNQRQRFADLAAIAHLPAEIQARFEGIYEEHLRLKAELADALAQMRAMRRAADGD